MSSKNTLLYKALADPPEALNAASVALHSSERQDRLDAVQALGHLGQYRAPYKLLITLLPDRDLGTPCILSLAQLKDSRALFPLMNWKAQTPRQTDIQRILQYCHHTRDPRAQPFLEQHIAGAGPFLDIAEVALNACTGNTDFVYRYNGTDDKHAHACTRTGQVLVTSAGLESIAHDLEDYRDGDYKRPQTYVMPNRNTLLIGHHIHEHVQVARGGDVIAAGQIQFDNIGGTWEVTMLDNWSCGYFPAANTFAHIARYFRTRAVDIRFEHTSFDKTIPREGFTDEEFLSIFKYGSNYSGD